MNAAPPAIAVFTDHGDPQHFQPYRRSVAPPRIGGRFLRAWVQAWRLWRAARGFRGTAAFVTYGSTAGFALAGLQALLAPFTPPRTHLMFDLLLENRRRGPAGWYDTLKMAAFRRAGVRAVVWGRGDGETFARRFALPDDRFQFHPYHTTLAGFVYEIVDDGYLFAGGNFGRDYGTLIAAVREIDYPVIIATTNPAIPPLARGCDHVSVRGVSPTEFRSLLAGCTAVVEAHPADFPRTAGHQTLLNAMALAKPVVLADERSAPGYVDHEVEGLVTPAGDVDGLRAAIVRLIADADLRARLGAAGKRRLADPIYDTPTNMQSIYNLALGHEHRRLGVADTAPLIELYGPADAGMPLAEPQPC